MSHDFLVSFDGIDDLSWVDACQTALGVGAYTNGIGPGVAVAIRFYDDRVVITPIRPDLSADAVAVVPHAGRLYLGILHHLGSTLSVLIARLTPDCGALEVDSVSDDQISIRRAKEIWDPLDADRPSRYEGVALVPDSYDNTVRFGVYDGFAWHWVVRDDPADSTETNYRVQTVHDERDDDSTTR